MICPNCGSEMNVLAPCPECKHVHGDANCECSFCFDDDDEYWEDEDCDDEEYDDDEDEEDEG